MQYARILRPDSIQKQPLPTQLPKPLIWGGNPSRILSSDIPRDLHPRYSAIQKLLADHEGIPPRTSSWEDLPLEFFRQIDYGETVRGKEAQASAIYELNLLINSSIKFSGIKTDHLYRSNLYDYRLTRDINSLSLYVTEKQTGIEHSWDFIPSEKRFLRSVSLTDKDRPDFLKSRKAFRKSFNDFLHYAYFYGYDTTSGKQVKDKFIKQRVSKDELDRFFFGPARKNKSTEHFPWLRKRDETNRLNPPLRLPRYPTSNTIMCYTARKENLLAVIHKLDALPFHIWFNHQDKMYYMAISYNRIVRDEFLQALYKICPEVIWHSKTSYFPLPFDKGHEALFMDRSNINMYETTYTALEKYYPKQWNRDGSERTDELFLSSRPLYPKSNVKFLTEQETFLIEMILAEVVHTVKFRSKKHEFQRNINRRNIALEMIGYAKYQQSRGRYTNPRIKMGEKKKALYRKGFQFPQAWLDHITEKYQMPLDTKRDLEFVLNIFFKQFVHPDGTRYNPFAGSCRQWTGDISEKALRKLWFKFRQMRILIEKNKSAFFQSTAPLHRNYKGTYIIKSNRIYPFSLSQYQYLSRGSRRSRRAELVRKNDEREKIHQMTSERVDRGEDDPPLR